MSSSFTSNVALEQPANGDYVNSWQIPVNADWAAIDAVFGNTTFLNAVSVTGTVALTLTQYRPRIIVISGALSGNINYRLPAGVGGTWAVFNNTTGNFTITMSSATGGGLSANLIQGYTTTVICDGTNIGPANTAPINPGGLTTQVQYNNSGVLAGSSNLTFNGSTLGLTGTLNVAGAASVTTLNVSGKSYLLGSSSGYAAFQASASGTNQVYTWPASAGSNGQVMTTDGAGNLAWASTAGGVSTFSAGTTGLTPSTATGGDVTLSGTLAVANGGTGATTSTGSGATVRATTPTLVTPVLGAATASSINGLNINTTTGTLGLANGSTLATAGSNSLTLTTTGTTNVTLPTSGTLATQTYANGTQSFNNAGWTKLPNGMIFQWGFGSSSGASINNATVSFPISFPNGILSIQATITGSINEALTVQAGSNSSSEAVFTVCNGSSYVSGVGFNYFAVGF